MSNPTFTPRITPEQKEFIKTCPPEQQQQRFVLFAYNNLSQRYRRQQQQEPTEEDFTRWLSTLSPDIARYMMGLGFAACNRTPLFMRFVRKQYEQDLSTFLQQYMSPHEYETALRLMSRRAN